MAKVTGSASLKIIHKPICTKTGSKTKIALKLKKGGSYQSTGRSFIHEPDVTLFDRHPPQFSSALSINTFVDIHYRLQLMWIYNSSKIILDWHETRGFPSFVLTT